MLPCGLHGRDPAKAGGSKHRMHLSIPWPSQAYVCRGIAGGRGSGKSRSSTVACGIRSGSSRAHSKNRAYATERCRAKESVRKTACSEVRLGCHAAARRARV